MVKLVIKNIFIKNLINPLGFFFWIALAIIRPVKTYSWFVGLPIFKKTMVTKVSRIVVIVLCSCSCLNGHAARDTVYDFAIPAIEVEEALKKLTTQTSRQLFFSYKSVNSQVSTAVSGRYTVEGALNILLKDTDLSGRLTKRGVILVTSLHATNDAVKGKSGMKAKKNLLAAMIGLFVGNGGIQQAVAQGDTSSNKTIGWVMEEIIVTAQKREQNLIDVPISIVALGTAEIEARGISNFEDLGMAIPGLTVQDNGGSNRRVFIRGLGNAAGFSSPLVGLYIDDVSVSGNPAFTLDVRPYDLERVEVLRGPQGTLYGDGSVGGTIRFITKKPQLDSYSGKADIFASFTEDGDPGQKIQAAVNVPLIHDELGLRIVGTVENAGGWIDQPEASVENYNDQDVTNIRVNGLWHATDALEVSAMVMVHRNDSSLNIGEDNNGNLTPVFGLTTRPSFEDDYELYNLTLVYDFESFDLRSSTSYLDSSTDTRQHRSRLGAIDVLIGENPIDTTIFTEELRISSTHDGAWNWTLGAFYKDRQTDQENIDAQVGPTGGSPSAPFSLALDNQNSKSWAVFGDTSYALSARWEIGVGLRFFKDDRELFDGAVTQAGTFDSTSPRVYVNFDLTEDIKTYASVAKGFRSGGFNNLGKATFDPETIWSYELGTKMSLLDGRLGTELAMFYSEYTDFQISGVLSPPAPPEQITSNGGDAQIKGVDVSFTWQATDGLVLGLNGNYVDTEIVKINLLSGSHIVGDRLDYVPQYSATLSVTQDFEWGAKPGFVRLDYSQQDEMLLTNRSRGVFGSSDVISMLNINVEWALNENISMGIFGKNLLNEEGFIDPLLTFGGASRPRPRTFGFQFGLDF
jgi:iron complex outermembrane recepter protein